MTVFKKLSTTVELVFEDRDKHIKSNSEVKIFYIIHFFVVAITHLHYILIPHKI